MQNSNNNNKKIQSSFSEHNQHLDCPLNNPTNTTFCDVFHYRAILLDFGSQLSRKRWSSPVLWVFSFDGTKIKSYTVPLESADKYRTLGEIKFCSGFSHIQSDPCFRDSSWITFRRLIRYCMRHLIGFPWTRYQFSYERKPNTLNL